MAAPASVASGSSPRARGTPHHARELGPRLRFIPASAGNTITRKLMDGLMPVHPRERGEHTRCRRWRGDQGGSSPRARGTPCPCWILSKRRRFIPASAGNTYQPGLAHPPLAVHPRERGEHRLRPKLTAPGPGSSPRARGTRPPRKLRLRHLRFIPASAGNTTPWACLFVVETVHPRERGEHRLRPKLTAPGPGSSPRARGTRGRATGPLPRQRFIPASAGNTRWMTRSRP